jgi:ABC-type multidrug transport system permease subunit
MRRFGLLLLNEFRLARNSIPIHLVAILQPTLLYLLLAMILVRPTFSMNVARPDTAQGWALVAAMEQVGAPGGPAYIEPVLVDSRQLEDRRQLVVIQDSDDGVVAVQHFGLIDNNTVKNLRNRLTAAALRVWDDALGARAVRIVEHPWLPVDVPYPVYFGIALLPLAAFVAAAFTGAVLTTQDFEFGTVLEYRLAPVLPAQLLAARLVRLVLSALLAVLLLLLVAGATTGYWPGNLGQVLLVMLPIAVIAGSLGIIVGLATRRSIPAFVLVLSLAIGGWILGDGFALAAGFGGLYERLSRLTPQAHAVELLFPAYYGVAIGRPALSAWTLVLVAAGSLLGLAWAYRRRMARQG